MHEHRNIERRDELEEGQRIIVIRVVAGQRRQDNDALAAILGDGALELAQKLVAAIRLAGRKRINVVVLLGERGQVAVDHLYGLELLRFVLVPQLVAGIADHRLIDASRLGGFEDVFDRHRALALPKRGARHFRRHDVRMEVQDHLDKPRAVSR